MRAPKEERVATNAQEVLVILSAHTKQVRWEFEYAFQRHYRERYGREVHIEWLDVGGTAAAARYIDDRYAAAFRNYYQSNHHGEWNSAVAAAFNSAAFDNADGEQGLARRRFLESDISIGVDIFWGGGTYEHARNADYGYAVDGGVQLRHPEYFADDIIPQNFSGEIFYDIGGRFYGSCLSTFGICYNPDRYRELGLPPPICWRDLARPELFGKVALGDPTKSGSVAKCFEMVIQQEMIAAREAGLSDDEGWRNAMMLLKLIAANANIITDSAGQPPREVSSGNSAAGICIDFYGFAEMQWAHASSPDADRIRFVLPENGSSLSPDPIQLLRGAPNRRTAEAFLDFVLSSEGQKLWYFKVGAPGGPEKYPLARPPIRRDLYAAEYDDYRIDPAYNPYHTGMVYRPELTARYFSLIRTLITAIMLDPADELRRAWRAVIAAGAESAPDAMRELESVPFEYSAAADAAAKLRPNGEEWTAIDIAATLREWTAGARGHYLRAEELANEVKK